MVDADDLMQEMYLTAKEKAQELGKLEALTEEEKEKSYEIVGLGALKYFMLKVDPKKKNAFQSRGKCGFQWEYRAFSFSMLTLEFSLC